MAVGTFGVQNLGQFGPGLPQVGRSPALDALQQLGSASPSSGMRPNENRMTENDSWGTPNPSGRPPATYPAQQSIQEQVLQSLRMAGPQPLLRKGPIKEMAPERREKPSAPALEG